MPKTVRRSVKKLHVFCGQCKLEVEEEEENSIQCDKCSKIYHALCTKLDKRQFEYLMNNQDEDYVCHVCNNENEENVKSELNAIKIQLTKLNQLDALQESMSFMSKQFDDIIKGIAENKKKLDVVQKENKVLKAEISVLKQTVRFLNDERVKNDCLVSGIEVSDNSSAVEAVINVMKSVDINLKTDEFEDAYFIGKNKNVKRKTVVAKFNSKASKQKVMSAKAKLNQKEETKSVFVNDYLGKETLNLLNHAKSLRSVGYRRVYAVNGKVCVKMSELSKPKLIKSADEVDQLLLESTKGTSRRSQRYQKENDGGSDEDHGNDDYLSPS